MLFVKTEFKEMYNSATERAKQMVEDGLYSRFNLSKEERIDKAKIGCLGEIAFQKILQDCGISYQVDEGDFSERNSDEFDFLINGKKVDIKVAKKSTPNFPSDKWTYGYPEQQNPSKKDFVVVGWVDFYNEEVGFYGWIRGNQISNFSVVRENSFAKYEYLTPNHEFQWGALNKDFYELKNLIEGKMY